MTEWRRKEGVKRTIEEVSHPFKSVMITEVSATRLQKHDHLLTDLLRNLEQVRSRCACVCVCESLSPSLAVKMQAVAGNVLFQHAIISFHLEFRHACNAT